MILRKLQPLINYGIIHNRHIYTTPINGLFYVKSKKQGKIIFLKFVNHFEKKLNFYFFLQKIIIIIIRLRKDTGKNNPNKKGHP